MAYELNGRKNICIFRNVMKFQEATACSKLQAPKIKHGYQVKKS